MKNVKECCHDSLPRVQPLQTNLKNSGRHAQAEQVGLSNAAPSAPVGSKGAEAWNCVLGAGKELCQDNTQHKADEKTPSRLAARKCQARSFIHVPPLRAWLEKGQLTCGLWNHLVSAWLLNVSVGPRKPLVDIQRLRGIMFPYSIVSPLSLLSLVAFFVVLFTAVVVFCAANK